jgi:hypothetical protein
VFPVRYEVKLYILLRINSVFKCLSNKGHVNECEAMIKVNRRIW